MPLPLYITAPSPTGGDDTTTLQAALDAMTNGQIMLWPCPALYKVSDTLYFNYNGIGENNISLGRPDTGTSGNRGTEFQWNGSAGKDSMIFLSGHRPVFEGFTLSCDFNSTPPACGIRIDNKVTPSGKPTNTTTTTGVMVRRCVIFSPSLTNGPSFAGIDNSRVATTNCDLGVFEDIVFEGGFYGWLGGSSTNDKSNRIYRCAFSGCSTAIRVIAGSAFIRDCNAETCGVDIQGDDVVDQFVVEGWNSETAGQALSFGGSSNWIKVLGCRWSNLQGQWAVNTTNQPGLFLDSCYFHSVLGTVSLFQPNTRSAAGIIMLAVGCNGVPLWTGSTVSSGVPSLRQFGLIEISGSSGF
jgi:hypothetical protein